MQPPGSFPTHLAFATSRLRVAYRGSIDPQRVRLDVSLAAPDPAARVSFAVMSLVEAIGRGAAGGAELDAALGQAVWAAGPLPAHPPAALPQLSFELDVQAVSPLFLRHVVESVALVAPVTAMSIVGSLPLDGSALSAREGDVVRWLRPRAHLGARPLPFPVREVPVGGGERGFVRLWLADGADDAVLEEFERSMMAWGGMLSTFADSTGLGTADVDPLPGSIRGGRALVARFLRLQVEREAAAHLLGNVAAAFHAAVAPVAQLDAGLPA